jgi:hypothetical protein
MQQITAIQYNKALLETKNKGAEFVIESRSKCGFYFSKANQVDTANYECIEKRYNRKIKLTKYYGSK